MEAILKEAVQQIPALVIFVAYGIAVYRLQIQEREARDAKWREFLKQESVARDAMFERHITATKDMSLSLGQQGVEFANLKKAVTRQTATILYTLNQKETNGDKMGIRELIELLSEGI